MFFVVSLYFSLFVFSKIKQQRLQQQQQQHQNNMHIFANVRLVDWKSHEQLATV